MLFSSMVFIYLFLPIVLIFYYLFFRRSRKLQNIFLLFASLFFYAWGEPTFVLVMIFSILMNWLFGLGIDKYKKEGRTKEVKGILTVSIILNLAILFVYKYLNFSVDTVCSIFNICSSIKQIALPIGISFFTFQAMSYVIDVYRGKGEVQQNLLNVRVIYIFLPSIGSRTNC